MKKQFIVLVPLLLVFTFPQYLLAQNSGTEVFRQEGIASWYGREFDGRPTASGEIYDSSLLTAAHPNLPFGTILVVTNRHNNRKVTVRVNDRGPFVAARIIDVSRAAAEQLDMIVTGTAPVIVESVDRIVFTSPDSAPSSAPAMQPAPQPAPQSASQVQPPRYENDQSCPQASSGMMTETQPAGQIAAQQTTVFPPAASSGQSEIPRVNQQPSATQASPAPQAPVTQTAPAAQTAVSQTAVPQTAPAAQTVPLQIPVRTRLTPETIIEDGKTYRLQIGSFRVARNAVEAFDRLKNVELNPAYERFTDDDGIEFFRVVLAGVNGADIESVTEKIGLAGFRVAVVREEN